MVHEHWLCLHWLRSWLPRLGARTVFALMLLFTTARWLCTWGKRRGPDPITAMQYLGRSGMSLLGVYALGLDSRNTLALLERFKPYAGAPRGSSAHLLYLSARGLAIQPLGREVEVREANRRALEMLETRRPVGMRERERTDMRVGLLLSSGINECYRAGSRAMDVADQLDAIGTQIGYAAAQRIRLTYHLVRAGREEVERHRRMLEVHAIQGGTTWQVEWFAVPVEGSAAARNGDLVSVRRSLERLESLVREVPSLAPLRDMVRVMYQRRRGNLDLALELGEAFVRDNAPRSVIGWPSGYATLAATLNDLGQHERALQVCELAAAHITDGDREYATIYGALDRERAFAYAATGRGDEAQALLEANLVRFEAAEEPMLLSFEYETVARIARMRGDIPAFRCALEKMREAAERSGSRFAVESARRTGATLVRSLLPLDPKSGVYPQGEATLPPTPVLAAEGLRTPVYNLGPLRAARLLRRAMHESGASSAVLFTLGPQGATVAASIGEPSPLLAVQPDVLDLASSRARASGNAHHRDRVQLRTVTTAQRTYDIMLLRTPDRMQNVGIVALGHEEFAGVGDLSESVIDKLAACAARG